MECFTHAELAFHALSLIAGICVGVLFFSR